MTGIVVVVYALVTLVLMSHIRIDRLSMMRAGVVKETGEL